MQTTRGTSLTETPQHLHRRVAARGTRRLPLVVAVAAFVVALDVVSKIIVVAKLTDRAPVRLLGGFLKLEETRNPGAAFSIGTGTTIVFAVVAIAVIVVILRTARRLASLPWSIVLGLLLGGATGNLIDRLVRSPGVFRGWVVDWIALPHFAVFNLADSAITIGAVLAVLLALGGRQFDGSVHKPAAKARKGTADAGAPPIAPPEPAVDRETPADGTGT
jgi:lipoprotein signal peptidase